MGTALRMFSVIASVASLTVWGLARRRRKAHSRQNSVDVPSRRAAEPPLSPSPRCTRVSALTKEEAEDLLHWLRSSGRMHVETVFVPEEGYTVFYF